MKTDASRAIKPIRLTTEPVLTISPVVMCPEAYATAFDVEAIGSMKANDEANEVGNMKYNGFTFSD